MCICKRSSCKSSTKRILTKTGMPPPPPPPPTRRFKGVPPPAPASANTHTTTTTASASPPAAASPTLSPSQLSAVLDPFFIDTCFFLREASAVRHQQQAPPATTADVNSIHHQRIEHAFLSGPAVSDEAADYARHGAKMASSSNGAGALDSFLLSSAAWTGAIQEMEAEKRLCSC